MFAFINRKLSRQVVVVLLAVMLPMLALTAFALIYLEQSRTEQETILAGQIAAKAGAASYASILETGIDAGKFTVNDLINPVYEEISGLKAKDPRFHTKYDFYTDMYIQPMEDAILHSNSDFIYTTGIDTDGYVPTTHKEYSQEPTGDKEYDLRYARSKMKYTSALHISAARSKDSVLVQPYLRDKVEPCWDIAVPIFVKGRHFGAFRVGVTRRSIEQHQHEAARELIIVFICLLICIAASVFAFIRHHMQPLEDLAAVAEVVSTGEDLKTEIKTQKTNEIGRMARSVNRLRRSLASAMARLNE